jgi:DNA-binding CsgD family transcriptional regulator
MVRLQSLSSREREVLRLVAQDRTDRDIARCLGIRERTVRAHVSRIILKLGVASRVGAAVAFVGWTMRGAPCQCADSGMAEVPMAETSGDMTP